METIFVTKEKIEVSNDAYIVDFGEIPNADIVVSPNVQAKYTFIPKNSLKIFRHFFLDKNTEFVGKSVIVEDGQTEIIAEAIGDGARAHLDLLAIATTDANISVEGVAKVDNPHKKLSIRVDQTNILIGEKSIIRGVPRLEIMTDDIEGGHSCKIHRLGGDALFYLESHGLPKENSEIFLLNSEILTHIDTLPEDIRENICSEIHKKLYSKK